MTRLPEAITLDEARQLAAITPKQARHLLGGMSRNAMYRAITSGSIPSCRIGGKILIPVEPLLDLLEKGGRR